MSYEFVIPLGASLVTILVAYLLAKKGIPKGYLVLDFGLAQKYCKKAGAAETILKYIYLPPDSHMKIMTDDFQKWIASEIWMHFIATKLDSGVKITAFAAGKANDQILSEIEILKKNKNFEIVSCGQAPFEKHFTTISFPQQIWYEEKHIGHFANECIYTRHPHEEVWMQIEGYFSSLRSRKAA